MVRVKRAVSAKKKHKNISKQAKGYFGIKSKLYYPANRAVMRSLTYAYTDRKQREREFRKLWTARINTVARLNGLSHSKFISGLKKASIETNRRMLSELAIHDVDVFIKLIEAARENI